MNDTIDQAVKLLARKIQSKVSADEALKYTQAALNLAHTKITLIEAYLVQKKPSEKQKLAQ